MTRPRRSLRLLGFAVPAVLLAALTLLLTPATHAAEREFKQTFPVQPGCTVHLDTYRGAVAIAESDTTDEVQVSLHMEIGADTEAQADQLRDALHLDTRVENNVVTLRARNPRETRVRFVWNDKYQMELTWRITVPRQCHVEATTLNGSVTVGNLAGRITTRVERGSTFLKNITGSVDAVTEYGDVVLSRCSGPVKIRVLKGLIRTGTMLGPVDLKNTTGDVEVMAAHAAITASAEAGDALIGFPRGRTGEARISSSGGSIRARIDPASDCVIEASATFGHVESQIPLTVTAGAPGKSKLTGTLGQGGAPIILRAHGGSVRLVPADDFL